MYNPNFRQLCSHWPGVLGFSSAGAGTSRFFFSFLLKDAQMPGWQKNSYALHSDDGRLFMGNGTGELYLKSCTHTHTDTVISSEIVLDGIELLSAVRSWQYHRLRYRARAWCLRRSFPTLLHPQRLCGGYDLMRTTTKIFNYGDFFVSCRH